MAEYTVVRTDNLAGIVDGSKLRSVRYYNDGELAEIENGSIVSVGGVEEGSRDVRVATAPTAGQKLGTLALVATPELMYDKTHGSLDEYVNAAGDACLAYILCSNDEFSVTVDGFDGDEIEVGDGVAVTAEAKLAVATENTIGEVIAVEYEGGYTYYVIHIN